RIGDAEKLLAAHEWADAQTQLDACEPDQRLWEWQFLKRSTQGALQTFYDQEYGDFLAVAYHPDGKLFAAGGSGPQVDLWNADSSTLVRKLSGHNDHVTAVVFSPNGKWLASASEDGAAILWDTETGKELRSFRKHTDKVRDIAFSLDGQYVASASDDGSA